MATDLVALTTQIYHPTILEARSPKTKAWAAESLLEASGEDLFPRLYQLLGAPCPGSRPLPLVAPPHPHSLCPITSSDPDPPVRPPYKGPEVTLVPPGPPPHLKILNLITF